jgi:excisionase family DNA binding protein
VSSTITLSDWVPIGRACVMLGVNPATLRQWTRDGKVHVYRTPGGHRRFSADELHALQAKGPTQTHLPAADAVIADLRLKYRGLAHSPATQRGWLARADGDQRLQFHDLGDQTLAALAAHLSADSPRLRQRTLAEARRLGSRYGLLARELGATPTQAVEAYLVFRKPMLEVLAHSLSTRRDPPEELGRVMRDAERFMDAVLVAISGESDGGTTTPETKRTPGL